MRITHKIAAALVAVLAVLLVGAAIILNGAVRPGFERLEQSAHQRSQARLAASLTAMADDMRARVTDYAYWNDTYDFAADGNRAYIDEMADPWIGTYGIDVVVFVNSAGRVLWQRSVAASGVAGDDMRAASALAAFVAAHGAGRAARTGTIWLQDFGFLTVSFAGITRSDGSGEPRGWVIMGRRLTSTALSQQTQMGVDLINAAAPGDMTERLRALEPAAPEVWSSQRSIYALSALRDPFGTVVGAVLTQQPREAMALGARSIKLTLLLLAVAAAVAVAALWVMLRALVIKRLDELEAHFRAQHDEPREAPIDPGAADEISRLTQAYNALVRRLSEAGAREQAALFRREAEAAANHMKSEFLANVSHELRRPLDAIIGYTELIGEELQGPDTERTRADLERVSEAARRVLGLISEVLDISRIDAGRLELRAESFRVDEMIAALKESASREGGLQVEAMGDLGVGHTDRRRLNQCLTATLAIARRLSERGPIILRASRRADMLRFEIQVIGAALSPEQLAHALDPLAGVHKPSSRLASSGLGLVVTRKLLSMLGGAFEVRSTADSVSFVLTVASVAPVAVVAPALAAG